MNANRILFVHGITDIGGGENLFYDLIAGLSKPDFEPIVILPGEGPLTDKIRRLDIQVFTIPFMGTGRISKFVSFLRSVPALVRIIRRENIRIVQANDFKPALLAGLAAQFTRTPVVWYVHGVWYRAGTLIRKKVLNWLIARFVCVSRTVLSSLAGYPAEKLQVMYPGIDLEKYHPVLHRDSMKPFTVTCIGRFDPVKGFEYFLDAAALILSHRSDCRVLLVGGDFHTQTGRYRQFILDKITKDELLQRNVEVRPFSDDILSIYQQTDLLVCASMFETLGMTILEAMACGIPVIATRCGGPEETVIPGNTGLLVPTKDARALADALLSLIADPELKQRMGINARNRVERIFSQKRFVDEFQTLYRQLAKS